ncbi:CRAL-TRIO domain-containing protein [Quillaja saponaria]|uniref:CRAL-TRIO domain-containing protein n=1 Tax=Quillaja saponaria TaxID=32244 RepID=A0AAD7KN22_QUISA|nr:CRAL-TRIO domain-containing protein [Quillaja saponaria]
MENKEDVMSLTQMKKSVKKLGYSTEMYGDPTLMRFLIARLMNPDKSAKMFVEWQKWRSSMVPNGFISESEISDELEARKVFLQGLSRDGYPVMIAKVNNHFPSEDKLQFKKYIIYLLDKTIASSFRGREIGNEKLIAILDLQQITYKNIDTRGVITAFQFLQAYYPERLAKCFILHMPLVFRKCLENDFSLPRQGNTRKEYLLSFQALLEYVENHRMIVIVSNNEERREFIKEVGEETLTEEYGGRAQPVAIQDVVLTPLEG